MIKYKFKAYQLRITASWLVNLSAGWFASIFLLLSQPLLLTGSILLSILCLYISMEIERNLDENY